MAPPDHTDDSDDPVDHVDHVDRKLDVDPKVKELLDAATAAELQKWFGLPSFTQLADQGVEVEDPEMLAVRERRAQAIAAVDPALLERHRRRTDPSDRLLQFKPQIEVRVDPDIGLIDLAMIDRQHLIAEPREVEISEELQDDLKDCTPQALLRDLHRPEVFFDKVFDVIDHAAEQTLDIVKEVADAMATNWKLPPLEASPFREAHKMIAALHAERRRPWPELFAAKPLPNRRFVEDK